MPERCTCNRKARTGESRIESSLCDASCLAGRPEPIASPRYQGRTEPTWKATLSILAMSSVAIIGLMVGYAVARI